MTISNRPAAIEGSIGSARLALLFATLLVALGSALQLGELGYGNLRPANLWMFSVIAPNIWNTLAAVLNAPYWQMFVRFWPLGLIGASASILFLVRAANPFGNWMGSRKGQKHV